MSDLPCRMAGELHWAVPASLSPWKNKLYNLTNTKCPGNCTELYQLPCLPRKTNCRTKQIQNNRGTALGLTNLPVYKAKTVQLQNDWGTALRCTNG